MSISRKEIRCEKTVLIFACAVTIIINEIKKEEIMNNYMFDLISFDEMDIVLKEFYRVLKKEGKLVLVNMTVGERFGSGIYDLMYRYHQK
jgi:predicted SAM-dependent methyltransferase